PQVLDGAILCGDPAGERIDHAGNDTFPQNLSQMLYIGEKFTAEQYVHDATVHNSSVVDCTSVGTGFIAGPAAVQHAADYVLVELAPVTERRSQILQDSTRTNQEGTEFALGASRYRRIPARYHRDVLAVEYRE